MSFWAWVAELSVIGDKLRLFRVLYSAILLMTLSALGVVAYILLTPVTTANVNSRVSSLCVIGNIAVQINEKFGLTGMTPKPVDCTCASARLQRRYGERDAARLTETTRQLFVNSVRNALSGQPNAFDGIDHGDLRSIQEFFGAIGEECKIAPA